MQLKKRQIAFLLFLIVATAFILLNRNSLTRVTFRTAEGSIFGTTYHIKYEAAQPLDSLILDTLRRVDNSLSLFNQQSTLCRINRGETMQADTMLAEVMRLAYDVGGREIVSNRIERLVTDGKVTDEQAAYLHAAAQAVCERTVERLAPTNAPAAKAD